MIVTSRTAERQPKHGGADGRQHVVHLVIAVLFDFILGDLRAVNARRQVAGRCQSQIVV